MRVDAPQRNALPYAQDGIRLLECAGVGFALRLAHALGMLIQRPRLGKDRVMQKDQDPSGEHRRRNRRPLQDAMIFHRGTGAQDDADRKTDRTDDQHQPHRFLAAVGELLRLFDWVQVDMFHADSIARNFCGEKPFY